MMRLTLSSAPGPMFLVHAIEQATEVDRLADVLGRVHRKLPEFLRSETMRGNGLGHSLHPVLTDLPIGCWVSATILDLVGGERGRSSATVLVGAGIATALPTALTGYADWSTLDGGDRRVGAVHAAGNVAALALYAGSLAARLRGRHGSGVRLAAAGALTSVVGIYLGGHLALSRGTADRT